MDEEYYEVDLAGNFTFINESSCRKMGYSREELIGKNYGLIVPEDDIQKLFAASKAVFKSGEPNKCYSHSALRKDGSIILVESFIGLRRNKQGDIVGFRTVSRDVTERKRIEDELRESERKLAEVIAFLPDATLAIDRDKRVIVWNKAIEEMTGVPAAEMMGRGDHAYTIPFYGEPRPQLMDLIFEDSAETACRYPAITRQGDALTAEVFCNALYSGRGAWVFAKASPLYDASGKVIGAIESIRDITAQRKAEQQYATLFREMLDGFAMHEIILDAAGTPVDYRFLGINPAFESMTGLKAGDIVGRTVLEVLPGTERQWIETYGKVALTGEPVHFENYSTELGKHFEVTAFSPVLGQFACVFQDITERKQAEETLKASEEKYRVIFNNEIYGICIFDLETLKLLDVNEAYCRLYGYSREELLSGMTIHDITAEHQVSDAATRQAIDEGTIFIPLRYHRKQDGTVFPVEIVGGPYVWQERKVMFALIHDITGRKQAEKEVGESEGRFREVLDNSLDASYKRNLVTNTYDYLSPVFARISGYTPDEMNTLPLEIVIDLIHPDDRAELGHVMAESLSGTAGNSYQVDYRFKRKDGQYRWLQDQFTVMRDALGQPSALIGSVSDITGRKQTEEALKEEQWRLRSIIEGTNIGTWEWNVQTGETVFNERWADIIGYTLDELSPISIKTWGSLVHTDDQKQSDELLERHFSGELPYYNCEYRMKHKDGHWVWVLDRGQVITRTADGKPLMMFGTHSDITARKRSEEVVRESEEQFRFLVNYSYDLIWRLKPDGVFSYVSPSWKTILGYEPSSMVDRAFQPFVHPDDVEECEKYMVRIMDAKKPLPGQQYRVRHSNGTWQWHEASMSPVVGDDGSLMYFVGVSRDITAQKLAEERSRFLSAVTEKISDSLIVTDTHFAITYINRAAEQLFGYTLDEVRGKTPDFLNAESMADQMQQELYETVSSGKTYATDAINKRKDGSTFICDYKVMPLKDEQDTIMAYVGIQRDITDRKRLEEERQRVDKLESIGTLAGGIAHDFNNILTAILGNINLARTISPAGSELAELILEAEKAALRAKQLTQQLLTFSKGGAPVRKVIQIERLVRDTAAFTLRGSNVKCLFDIDPGLWTANVDEGQIGQVINNIVLNARQAMPNGGAIGIAARNITLNGDDSIGRGLPLEKGDYVRVALVDRGTGIPADHLERIFDPYFTTKQTGSGLGLSICFSIVRNHGGHIAVESEINKGTTFYVYLPATHEKESGQAARAPLAPARPGKRLLVMDDEAGVRGVAVRMLRHLGYSDAWQAADGREAVDMYAEAMRAGRPFDAVILDITVPGGMGGIEAFGKLRELDPEVRGIISSGYAEDKALADFADYGFKASMAKPYTLEQISEALERALSGAGG